MSTEDYGKKKLIFVYNADSGAFNLLADIAHKIFSPATYACHLCVITHTSFGMKKEWKEYLKSLDSELEFLHADEFEAKYKRENVELPAIFSEKNGDLILAVSARAINECQTVGELKDCLRRSDLQNA